MKKPLFISIPHSGEKIPAGCDWLTELAEPVLMCDVDRYVDRLYQSALSQLKIPSVQTLWHRYAADLNRIPEDVDQDSIEGNTNPSGSNSRGFHWVKTTTNIPLMKKPMTKALHEQLVQTVYEPFHQSIRAQYDEFARAGAKQVYHIDAHSMPSLGTSEHRDPGERRADIVVSDCKGKSCEPEFLNLVVTAYTNAGFRVVKNWPYFGGRVSEQYGDPKNGRQVLQVELNRSLYMNEVTKQWLPEKAQVVESQLVQALRYILAGIVSK